MRMILIDFIYMYGIEDQACVGALPELLYCAGGCLNLCQFSFCKIYKHLGCIEFGC